MALGRNRKVLGAVGGMLRKRREQRMIARSPKQQMTQAPTTPKVPLQNSQVADSEGLMQAAQSGMAMQQSQSGMAEENMQSQQAQQGMNQVQGRLKRKRSRMGLAQSAMQNPASAV